MSIIKSCRTTKGFTLMEILFVLLLIALIVSFAMPAFRSVRHDIRNSRAKAALKKLAEARRSYYQATKGIIVRKGTFEGSNISSAIMEKNCEQKGTSGIPSSEQDEITYLELFRCGFLNWKDFAGLPYTFVICQAGNPLPSLPCRALNPTTEGAVSVAAIGTADAGKKYSTQYYMYVAKNMQVVDNSN